MKVGKGKQDLLRLQTESGAKKFEVPTDPKQAGPRGGKGRQLVKKAQLVAVPEDVVIAPLANAEGGEGVH